MQQIRAIAPMYDTAFHFVVEGGSSIQTLEDLNGKIVGVGPAGGTSDGYVPRMLTALGVSAVFKRRLGSGPGRTGGQEEYRPACGRWRHTFSRTFRTGPKNPAYA